jgi:hypothetical protein
MALILRFVSLALFVVIVVGLSGRLHVVIVAVASAIMGWIIAESNALRNRLAQWPILRRYIDWKHVQEDLANDNNGT